MRRILLLVLSILLFPAGLFASEVVEDSPREVSINFNINALSNINNRNGTFYADFYIIYQWKDPALDGKKESEIDWSKEWKPNIESVNSDNIKKQYDDIFKITGPSQVQMTQRYKGVFNANFNLHKFPFDTQIFPIILESSTHMADKLTLRYKFNKVKNKLEKDEVYQHHIELDKHIDESVNLAEWRINSLTFIEKVNYYRFDSTYWSQIRIEIEMSRKIGFYLWNFVLVIFLIVFLAWCIFFLDPEKVSDRLRGVLSLFLSTIAFSLVTTTMLPKIPYLTLLDYFMKLSYLLLVLIVIESLYVNRLSKIDEEGRAAAKKIDHYSRLVFPLLFVTISLIIWFMAE
jgi:hypothetical protein